MEASFSFLTKPDVLSTVVVALLTIFLYVMGTNWTGGRPENGQPAGSKRPPKASGGGEKHKEEEKVRDSAADAERSLNKPQEKEKNDNREAAQQELAIATTKSEERFQGVVKRFSERHGMGFITCRETLEKHNVDVRVFRSEYVAAELHVDAGVSFRTVIGGHRNCPNGHPWATEIVKLSADEAAVLAAANADSAALRADKDRKASLRPDSKPESPKRASEGSKGKGKSKGDGTRRSEGRQDRSGTSASKRGGERTAELAALLKAPRTLSAAAEEFVPQLAGRDIASADAPRSKLQADAPAFVPQGAAARNTSLDASAPEFIPRQQMDLLHNFLHDPDEDRSPEAVLEKVLEE